MTGLFCCFLLAETNQKPVAKEPIDIVHVRQSPGEESRVKNGGQWMWRVNKKSSCNVVQV